MRPRADIYLVGGGDSGFNLSARLDCHVCLVDTGAELVLIDAGSGHGGTVECVLGNIRSDGLDPRRITHLFQTHDHADHAGGGPASASGSAWWRTARQSPPRRSRPATRR